MCRRWWIAAIMPIALAAGCPSQEFQIGVLDPLRVVRTSPSHGATDVPVQVTISVLFSEPVALETVAGQGGGAVLWKGGAPGELNVDPVSFTASAADAHQPVEILIDPTEPLEYGETYVLELTPFVERLGSAGYLPEAVLVQFTTAPDPGALEVVAVWPADGATGVPLTDGLGGADTATRPTVLFSHAVDSADEVALAEHLRVLDVGSSASIAGAWSLDQEDTRAAFTPDGPWSHGQRVRVEMVHGLSSTAEGVRALEADSQFGFVFEEAPEFRVLAVHPPDGAADVPLEDGAGDPLTLTVSFSEPVDPAVDGQVFGESHAAVIDRDSGLGVAGGWTLDAASASAEFSPAGAWSHGQAIELAIDHGLRSARGVPLGAGAADDVVVRFRFEDPPPLSLLAVDPADGAVRVPRTDPVDQPTPVIVSFDQPLDLSRDWTGHLAVLYPGDPADRAVAGAWTLTGGDRDAVFTPDGEWEFGAMVEIEVDAGLTAAAGGQLAADHESGFTIEPAPDFFVQGTVPLDGSTEVPRSTALTVSFSEPVGSNTAEFAAQASVTDGSGAVAGAWSLDATQRVAEFTPAGGWRYGQPVQVDLQASLFSVHGVSLAGGAYRFGFTLESPLSLVVLSTDPADGAAEVPLERGGGPTVITVTFNQAIESPADPGAVFGVADQSDTAVAGTWSIVDAEATFTPGEAWDYLETIRVTLRGELRSALADESAVDATLGADHVFAFTFRGPPPFAVVRVHPTDGATGVPREDDLGQATRLRVEFSEALDPAVTANDFRVEYAAVTDRSSGAEVAGTWSLVDESAEFLPTGAWEYSQAVDLLIDADLPGASGSTLGQDFGVGFYFEDPPPLLLIARAPAPDATEVPVDATLSWTFDRPLDAATVTAQNFSVWLDSDPAELNLCPLGGAASLTPAGDAVDCVPAGSLPEGETVQVRLVGGPAGLGAANATSLGGWLDESTPALVYSFETRTAPVLGVAAITLPRAASEAIVVSFDRALDPASVDDATVIVRECLAAGPCPEPAEGIDLPATNDVVTGCLAGEHCISFSDGDTRLTWSPAPSLAHDTSYTLLLTEGLASADGRARPAAGGYAYHFTTDPPASLLLVPPTEPPAGATGVGRRPVIALEFSEDVDLSTLHADPPDGDGLVPNVYISTGAAGDRDRSLVHGIDYQVGASGLRRALLAPLRNLELGQTYTVTATLDLRTLEGGRPAAEQSFSFTTRPADQSLLESLSPADHEAGVGVDVAIVARFREDIDPAFLDESTFSLSFEDALGRVWEVPGSVDFDPGVDPRTATFVPTPSRIGHTLAGDWPLLYQTSYGVRLSPRIAALSGAGETLDLQSRGFTTRAAPTLEGRLPGEALLRSEGVLPGDTADDRDALHGAPDVPVNSVLWTDFDQPMDPATLKAGDPPQAGDTVLLERTADGQPVRLSVSWFAAADRLSVEPVEDLDPDTEYELRIRGGEPGQSAATADGQPLLATERAVFRTSPAPSAEVTLRAGESPLAGGVVGVVFNRPVRRDTIEGTLNLEVRIDDVTRSCSLSFPPGLDPALTDAVSCLPDGGGIGIGEEVRVLVGRGVTDAIGNPLSAAVDRVLGLAVDDTPTPPAIAVAPIAPMEASGDQRFIATFNGALPDDRIDPVTVHGGSSEIAADDATVALFEQPGGGFVPCEVRFLVASGPGQPDRVEFWPRVPLQSSATYEIHVGASLDATRHIRTLGGAVVTSVIETVDVETDPPAALAVEARYWNPVLQAWEFRAADSALDVPGDTRLRVTLDEALDPATAAGGLALVDGAAAPVPATVLADPTIADAWLIVPDANLSAGAPYDVVLTAALADVAGNAVGGPLIVASFAIEDADPTVAGIDAVEPVALDAAIRVTFSEPLDAETLVGPLDGPGATVFLEHLDLPPGADPCGTLQTGFTIAISDDRLSMILTPQAPGLAPNRQYSVRLDSAGVRDWAGAALVDPAAGALDFVSADGPPRLLCSVPGDADRDPAGAIVLHRFAGAAEPLGVALHFSEAVTLASLQAHARLVDSGAGQAVAASIAEIAPGSYWLTPGAVLRPGAGYPLELDAGVADPGGAALDPAYFRTLYTPDLVLNEVLFDPPPPAGDANCDGAFDALEDQFVELVNLGPAAFDLSGATLEASGGLRHSFVGGTVIPGHGALLVFGGGAPDPSCFPGVAAIVADSGLALGAADGLILRAADGAVIDRLSWSWPAGLDRALVRDPEGCGELMPHDLARGADGRSYSPGERTDGIPY